ncbi:MAG: ligase-associated DNA damage response exonuclease [Beijerinckiaceae bacterium]
MSVRDLLTLRPEGLYCPSGDFYVDPLRPVHRALITHGHADHARAGHGSVLATGETLAIMEARYGAHFCATRQPVRYGEKLRIGDTDVAFHPAGHVLGSAQIAIDGMKNKERGRIVVSGDYKRTADPTCTPFEPVRCDIFITEATFALPVFRQPDVAGEISKLLRSTQIFPDRAHLVGCYSLGKAQRIAALIRAAGWDRPLYLHGAMEKLMALYESHGISFAETIKVTAANKKELAGEIVLCPPSSLADTWSRGFPDPIACFASGWMRIRAHARRRGIELPLVVSDHADWGELTQTIVETRCEEVWITHGEADALMHWAAMRQLRARPLHLIGYGEEEQGE